MRAGGEGEAESGEGRGRVERRGKATRGEKTRTLLILFHMHTSILCMQIFGTDNIVFAIDTPYKATMSRTDAPAQNFPTKSSIN